MPRYEFTIKVPLYLPGEAIEELKQDVKRYLEELAGRCGVYEVKAVVRQKTAEAEEAGEEEEGERR